MCIYMGLKCGRNKPPPRCESKIDHVTPSVPRATPFRYNIAGPLCFSGDQIALGRPLPRIIAGDHLVIHDCGGYTLSMYCRYNSRPAPPVYAYEDARPGELAVWREAETVDDVLKMWDCASYPRAGAAAAE